MYPLAYIYISGNSFYHSHSVAKKYKLPFLISLIDFPVYKYSYKELINDLVNIGITRIKKTFDYAPEYKITSSTSIIGREIHNLIDLVKNETSSKVIRIS